MLGALPAAAKKTVGADKNYDTAAFVAAARSLNVIPHVARNITAHRGSNIDGRTARHDGYRTSQVIRKRSRRRTAGSRRSARWRRRSSGACRGSAGYLC